MALFGILAGAASLISAGTKVITGINQRNRANELERQNVFPEAQVNSNLIQNSILANQRASEGLPQAQYNLALQNINRNQAGALNVFQRGGSNQSLSSILRATNDANLQLDAVNAQARQQNQLYADQARSTLAQEEQRVFNWNEAQPYLRNLQNIGQLRQSGNANIWGGISSGLGSAINIAGTSGLFGNTGQRVLPIANQATSPALNYTSPNSNYLVR